MPTLLYAITKQIVNYASNSMPRVIKGVLQAELVHSRRMQRRYAQMLRRLGKGSLVKKRIGGSCVR